MIFPPSKKRFWFLLFVYSFLLSWGISPEPIEVERADLVAIRELITVLENSLAAQKNEVKTLILELEMQSENSENSEKALALLENQLQTALAASISYQKQVVLLQKELKELQPEAKELQKELKELKQELQKLEKLLTKSLKKVQNLKTALGITIGVGVTELLVIILLIIFI